MLRKLLPLFFLTIIFLVDAEELKSDEKILICGVCRNVASTAPRTIENAEALGSRFAEYHVIFYENNSTDDTATLFSNWAAGNERVTFMSEQLEPKQLPPTRVEKIARARNIVLSFAKDPKFADFKYLVMVDLDSPYSWPVDEILNTIHSDKEWDVVSANDNCIDLAQFYVSFPNGFYRDRYAFRDKEYPLGPEVIGDSWWSELAKSWFQIDTELDEWIPVHSAFGALAIYKTESILPFSYSGTVTEDLKSYYNHILSNTSPYNRQRIHYLGVLAEEKVKCSSYKTPPLIFRNNTPSERPNNYPFVTVCEHVTLHAAMAMNGHGKFYINPKMVVRFSL